LSVREGGEHRLELLGSLLLFLSVREGEIFGHCSHEGVRRVFAEDGSEFPANSPVAWAFSLFHLNQGRRCHVKQFSQFYPTTCDLCCGVNEFCDCKICSILLRHVIGSFL
jgi:hypothetical protein